MPIPGFLYKLHHLQQKIAHVNTKNVEGLVGEVNKINKELITFSDKIDNYAKQKDHAHTPEGVICFDLAHSFRGGIAAFNALSLFLHELVDENISQTQKKDNLAVIGMIFERILKELESLHDFDVNLQRKSSLGELLPSINETFSDLEIDIDKNIVHGFSVLCNPTVFKSLLKEVKENYRKYGINGKVVVRPERGQLTISLFNQKKER